MNTRNRWHNQTLVAAVIAMFSLAAMTGCDNGGSGDNDSNTAPTGTYQSKMGPDQIFYLNFLGDNEIEAKMSDGGQDESYRTTFVTSGDTIIMNIPEAERQPGGLDSMILKRNGEALEWTVEGMTIRFVKP